VPTGRESCSGSRHDHRAGAFSPLAAVHPSRIAIIAGAGLGGVSLLVPFLSAPLLGTIGGVEADAWPAVFLLLIPAATALVGDRREGFGLMAALATAACAAAAAIFAAAKAVDTLIAARDIRANGVAAQVGPGPWVLLAACTVVIAGIIASLSRRVH